MKTKFFTLFLALMASAGTLFASDIEVNGIWYNFYESKLTASVTYRGSSSSSYSNEYTGDVVIPEKVAYNEKDYTVIRIEDNAFYKCTGLTSVTIPASVTSICYGAFSGCTGLMEINVAAGNPKYSSADGVLFNKNKTTLIRYPIGSTISFYAVPNSVTSISWSAFAGCTGLESVTIGNSVTSIGESAFAKCTGLTSVTIPASVTSIGESAFSYCTGLTSVTIPASVTSIGEYAFYKCTGLASVTIPASVTSIGESAFAGCTKLPIEDNIRYADTYLVEVVNKTLSTYTIKEGTRFIGDYAFAKCTGLTTVAIPESVTSIGRYAFSYCTGLTSVAIPASVTSIGWCAFAGCTILPIEDNIRYADTYLVEVVKKTLSTYTIKEGTRFIGDVAFADCSGMAEISIPNSVTSIGEYAFRGCTGLTSVAIPNSVTSIGEYAFEDCTGLESVSLGNSLTSIGEYAFSYCTGLASVTIPASVTSIGESAFRGCTGLTSVAIPASVTSIGEYAFSYCTGLASVTIPASVTSIGESAFYHCTGLTSVTIPASVTSIGESAFNGCTGLTSVTIPNSVTSIGEYAFEDCTGLESVTIGNSITSIGDSAFYWCRSLKEITCLAEEAPALGVDAFSYGIPVYVPEESVDAYKAAEDWREFGNILPYILAEEAEVSDIQAEPTNNSAVIAWPAIADAVLYTIDIKKDYELICRLFFNKIGQLLGIDYGILYAAPARKGSRGNAKPRMALKNVNGWKYTVADLEANTTYSYSITVKKSDDSVIYQNSISFTTKNSATAIDQVTNDKTQTTNRKLLRNGQLIIEKNSKLYNAQGAEVK